MNTTITNFIAGSNRYHNRPDRRLVLCLFMLGKPGLAKLPDQATCTAMLIHQYRHTEPIVLCLFMGTYIVTAIEHLPALRWSPAILVFCCRQRRYMLSALFLA